MVFGIDKDPRSKKLQVLVVDDEPRWSELVCKITTHLGHSVKVATSGNEAIEMIKQSNAYDRVISDTRMIDGDGIDLLEFLYTKYGAGTRAVTYLHSSDDTYHTPDGKVINLPSEIPERFPGTIFKRKSTNTFDDVEEFLSC